MALDGVNLRRRRPPRRRRGTLIADLHARLDDSPDVPPGVARRYCARLNRASDAIGFLPREVAGRCATDNEAEARRATSLLYLSVMLASAVALAWEGGLHPSKCAGDAHAGCCCRALVIDHRGWRRAIRSGLTENATQRAISGHLLGDRGSSAWPRLVELLMAS